MTNNPIVILFFKLITYLSLRLQWKKAARNFVTCNVVVVGCTGVLIPQYCSIEYYPLTFTVPYADFLVAMAKHCTLLLTCKIKVRLYTVYVLNVVSMHNLGPELKIQNCTKTVWSGSHIYAFVESLPHHI